MPTPQPPPQKKPKPPRQPEPSKVSEVNLQHEFKSWTAVSFARVAALCTLITAIVLGSIRQVFSIKSRSILGNAVVDWNYTLTADHQTTSADIRWQLYGSGPRLAWEWVSVMILIVLLLAVVSSLVFSLINRVYPGEWLKAGGMLVAASTSPPIASITGKDEREMAKLRFFVKKDAANGKVFLTDNAGAGTLIDPRKRYTWSG